MTEDYMTRAELDRYIDQKLRRNQRGGIGGFLFTLACLIPVLLLVARVGPEVAVMYGVPLPFAATPGVVFSTVAPLPPATIRENPLPPIPTPRIVEEAQPAIMAEQPTPAPTTAPYTVKANLGESSPASNPGFTCGVEPGMDPNATCEGPLPAPDMGDDAPPPSLYSVEDRVFQPAVLPTSNTDANPGFSAAVEPGSEPTPVR